MRIIPPTECKICGTGENNQCGLLPYDHHNCPGILLDALFSMCSGCLNRVPIKHNLDGARPYHVWSGGHQDLCELNFIGRESIRNVLGEDYIPDYLEMISKAKYNLKDWQFL